MRSHDGKRTGLSVVELLAIVTILALIAAIFAPRGTLPSDATKNMGDVQKKIGIDAALEREYTQDARAPINEPSDDGAALVHPPSGVLVTPLDVAI